MDDTDDSIRMTVTINPLVSPLLHEALSRCRSARERAMRLRALAESALREPSQRGRDDVPMHEARAPVIERPRAVPAISPDDGVQILRVADFEKDATGLDSASLGNQLAEFF
jgi:hypothetical protein